MSTTISTLLSALLAAAMTLPALACEPRVPTPAASSGPHDFSHPGHETRLWREGDAGEPLYLRLRVLDQCGEPLKGATMQLLHANHEGVHEAGRWRTVLDADALGEAQVVTVYPGYAGGLARHIHFIVDHPDHPQLVTRLFFRNDPSAGERVQPLSVILEEVERNGQRGWATGFEFVLSDPT